MDFYPKKDGGAERTDWKRVCGRGRPTRASLPSSYAGVTKKKCKLHRRRRASPNDKRTATQIDFTKNEPNERSGIHEEENEIAFKGAVAVSCAKSSAHAFRKNRGNENDGIVVGWYKFSFSLDGTRHIY